MATIFIVVVIAAVLLIVVGAMRGSGPKRAPVREASYASPGGGAAPGPSEGALGQQASGQQLLEQRAYMEGVSHRSNATIFGVIGLFILGIVFGPLAIAQANKAEALGVKATAGRVLGAISLIFALLWVLFIFFGAFIRG